MALLSVIIPMTANTTGGGGPKQQRRPLNARILAPGYHLKFGDGVVFSTIHLMTAILRQPTMQFSPIG
jgi:hypothetical protein